MKEVASPGPSGVGVGVDEPGRVELGDRPGGLDLAPEAPDEPRFAGELLVHHLDGDLVGVGRAGEKDAARPSLPQHPLDGERADPTWVTRLEGVDLRLHPALLPAAVPCVDAPYRSRKLPLTNPAVSRDPPTPHEVAVPGCP
jgi:hypothetical protein